LDAITSKDAAALSEWSSGACVGDPPQPDTKGREVAQKKLFAASARADAARAAMRTLEAESVAHAEARGPFNVAVQMATSSYLAELHSAQQAELRQLDDRRAVLTAVSAATWSEAQRRHAGIAGRAAEDADAARVAWIGRRDGEIDAAFRAAAMKFNKLAAPVSLAKESLRKLDGSVDPTGEARELMKAAYKTRRLCNPLEIRKPDRRR